MRRAGPLLLALWLAACDAEQVPAACSGDPPCPPPSSLLRWAALLVPPANRTQGQLLPHEEPELTFSSDGSARLRFTQPVHLRGTVVDEEGRPVQRARVVALLPAAIPGQTGSSFETTTDDKQGAFSLRVPMPRRPADRPYRLWVGFDDPEQAARRPPIWLTGIVADKDVQVTIRARRRSELFEVRGTVVDLFGGVGGMRLQVMDERREIVSTTAISQEQDGELSGKGAFSLLVDPRLTEGKLQLVAWPGPRMTGVPVLSQPLSYPGEGNTVAVEVRMPPYKKPVPFTLTIRGTGTSGATQPVPGARVQAQVYLPDPLSDLTRSLYSASGETDKDGEVTLPLVPSTGDAALYYTILVQSPAQSPFASSAQQVVVGPGGGTILLSLPLRAQLSGRLLSEGGQPVAGAQVLARSITNPDQGLSLLGGLLMESLMPQATTDMSGRFALRLDPGDYDLDFVPVAGTQPRFSLDNQRILTDDVELGFIKLPRPTLGRVQVLGPDGAPVEGAMVQVYQLPDTTPRLGGACDLLRPCSRSAKLRAEVVTSGQGRAALLLPDRPMRN